MKWNNCDTSDLMKAIEEGFNRLEVIFKASLDIVWRVNFKGLPIFTSMHKHSSFTQYFKYLTGNNCQIPHFNDCHLSFRILLGSSNRFRFSMNI